MADLEQAIKLLQDGCYTCVLWGEDRVYTSSSRGVKPLVQWLRSGLNGAGFFAADRVVGKATAFLYVLLGVQAVYAHVISRSALDVLRQFGIDARYGTLVHHIINRKGDGMCPVEAAVTGIADSYEALQVIIKTLETLQI